MHSTQTNPDCIKNAASFFLVCKRGKHQGEADGSPQCEHSCKENSQMNRELHHKKRLIDMLWQVDDKNKFSLNPTHYDILITHAEIRDALLKDEVFSLMNGHCYRH